MMGAACRADFRTFSWKIFIGNSLKGLLGVESSSRKSVISFGPRVGF